jgi:hypothetical protein
MDYPFIEAGTSYTGAAKTDPQVIQNTSPRFFVRKLKSSRQMAIGSTIMRANGHLLQLNASGKRQN